MYRPLITEIDRYRRLLDNSARPINVRVLLVPHAYDNIPGHVVMYGMVVVSSSSTLPFVQFTRKNIESCPLARPGGRLTLSTTHKCRYL